MLTKEKRFIIAIIVQLGIIFGIIIFKIAVLTSGTDILLRITNVLFEGTQVNNKDLLKLRGEYLTFSYEISNLSFDLFIYSPIKNGDTVYVPLKQQGKYWIAVYGIQKTKPINEGKIFIKGKILNSNNNTVQLVYGIEDYFIPEKTDKNFILGGQEVAAKISIDKNGNAVLKQIYVNDKSWP